MKALHLLLIVVSCASSVIAQDPNYLAHGLYHPDVQAVISLADPVPVPGGPKWADSYSVGDKCYCILKDEYGNGLDNYPVETTRGWFTVKQVCTMVGAGPGPSGHPLYNDIQCGNGPPDSSGEEHTCPGRVDIGRNGCGQIGPTWKLDEIATLPYMPANEEIVFFRDVGNKSPDDTAGLTGKTWAYKSDKSVTLESTALEEQWFQTHRSGLKFTYTLGGFVAGRRYRVALGFAEVWEPNCKKGKRIQRIIIQNNVVRDNMDVYHEAGCRTAYLQVFDGSKAIVADSNGNIRIRMEAIEENAMLSTIKIEPASNNPPPPTPAPPPPSPPSPSPSPSTAKLVIDVGSKAEGTNFAQGKTWTYGVSSATVIKGTSQKAAFRTHRSAPKILFEIPGLAPGSSCKVDLGFCEIWAPNCQNGKRVMNIKVNGESKTRDLDVYKEATKEDPGGNGCNRALIKTYNNVVANSSGQIVIELEATVENAMVSLIEISGATASAPTSPPSGKQISIDAGNSGGEDMTLISGTSKRWGKSTLTQVSPEFRSHRYGQNFKYVIGGFDKDETYIVSLGFCEIYSKACEDGKRRFKVKINGSSVESDLDVYETAGCTKELVRTYERKPNSQGKFEIGLEAIKDNAMISFIEIKPK